MQQILVAGAGPAGAAAAISARLEGSPVRVVDRAKTSRHKVCGEFLSPGAREILEELRVWDEFAALGPTLIRRCALYLGKHRNVWTLPECGWGLSRLKLDRLLLRKAVELGAVVQRGEVFDPREEAPAGPLILACGRKPALAHGDRLFGFKAHFEGPGDDAVELFFDTGAYVGVSCVEDGLTNVCGIARESILRKHGFDFDELVHRSPPLGERLRPLVRTMRWLVVGPLSFSFPASGEPRPGRYEAGDSLSFVDPFTGSGILNALITGSVAGRAAAHGTSSAECQRLCRSLLGPPFLISSVLRRLAGHAEFHCLARWLPGGALFRWTRVNVDQLPGNGNGGRCCGLGWGMRE